MKRFEVYKNIRKKALIFGLPVSLFAIMMVSILASLLVIIFSFSLKLIISTIVINSSLYFALIRITVNPNLFHFGKKFPDLISNRKHSGIRYE